MGVIGLGIALGALAQAQQVPTISPPDLSVQHYRLPIDAEGFLWTDDAGTAPTGHVRARFATHMMADPLVYRFDTDGGQTEVAVVSSVVQSDLSVGATWEFLRVGLAVPVLWSVDGDQQAAPVRGLGELAVDVKGAVLDREGDDRPVGVAVTGRLGLPTATVDAPVVSGGMTGELAGVVDARVGPVLVAGNLGVRFQPEAALDSLTWNDLVVVRAAAAWFIVEHSGVSVDWATHKALGIPFDVAAGRPSEVILGGFSRLSDSWVVRGGAGTGVGQGIGAPDWRAVVAVGWEPLELRDKDLDEIWDRDDACPLEPEDVDGFRDTDGCPDPLRTLTLFVADPVGDGLDIATVEVQTPAGTKILDGREVALDLHPGQYPVLAYAPRYTDYEGMVEVPEDRDRRVELTLAPTFGELRVNVRGPEGERLAGRLVVDGERPLDFRGGVGSLDVTAGERRALVVVDGYKEQTLPVRVRVGQRTVLDVVLEPAKAQLEEGRIEIREKVFFDVGRATIRPESFALLDEVAAILVDHPEVERVQVEGHTDSNGSASRNRRLSQARAESVVAYLVDKGVAAERLVAVGFGEDRPLVEGRTAEAHEQNRRVEFVIASE